MQLLFRTASTPPSLPNSVYAAPPAAFVGASPLHWILSCSVFHDKWPHPHPQPYMRCQSCTTKKQKKHNASCRLWRSSTAFHHLRNCDLLACFLTESQQYSWMRGVGAHCRGRLVTLRCSLKVLPCSLPLPFSCISLPSCHSSLHPSLFLSDLRIGHTYFLMSSTMCTLRLFCNTLKPHCPCCIHFDSVFQRHPATQCFCDSSRHFFFVIYTQPHVLVNPFYCIVFQILWTMLMLDQVYSLLVTCVLPHLTVFLRYCFLIFFFSPLNSSRSQRSCESSEFVRLFFFFLTTLPFCCFFAGFFFIVCWLFFYLFPALQCVNRTTCTSFVALLCSHFTFSHTFVFFPCPS